MASQDTEEKPAPSEKSHDDLPMIWDTKSILLTVGFLGGALAVAWALFTVVGWFGGRNRMILLSREEAARMVRERGCKCRKARSSLISGTGRPRKEDYVCTCPDSAQRKQATKQPKKKTASKPKPAGKPVKKAPASGSSAPAVKEAL